MITSSISDLKFQTKMKNLGIFQFLLSVQYFQTLSWGGGGGRGGTEKLRKGIENERYLAEIGELNGKVSHAIYANHH